ncbi:hypothetical protein A0128_20165 [Leptospira tipperaryensis]|uniref:Uncharacterized protein n=1 Tax=Leptospira tipperaryensis TaxID=2564040 RepID=A0A1D7V3D5_9LEPT|nr:hypothetical protein [Leptospira tipperaryensis]AOP36336.1 hypothetical protein A0128_20165 [Leptospira tipperaryensis]
MPILGKSYDLFGDGSVWILSAHRHTEGEIAVLLNTTSGAFLFTFDSSHLRAGFENEITRVRLWTKRKVWIRSGECVPFPWRIQT